MEQGTEGDDGGGQIEVGVDAVLASSGAAADLPKSLSQELVTSTTQRRPTWMGAGSPRWAICPVTVHSWLTTGRSEGGLFKALGHPARIRALELLAERESTISELAVGTGLELSHLSQQVSVLRKAGIVVSRRSGNNVICELADPQTAELLAVARRMLTLNLRQSQKLLDVLDGVEDAVALADTARVPHPSAT